MLAFPSTDVENGVLDALTPFWNRLAKGRVPADVVPRPAREPLIPLRKRYDGVRTVAVGDTISRFNSSLFMSRLAPSGQAFLGPQQVGVETRGAAETVVHGARFLVQALGNDDLYGLLK